MTSSTPSSSYVRTPLIESVPLRPYSAGRKVFLKLENCQPSGSFKMRGISALCEYAKSRGFTRMVCASAGNAGLATAFSAMQLGLQCHIVVFRLTSDEVKDKIRSFGATVESFGDVWDEAYDHSVKITQNSDTSFLVHPFDHPILWEGHSTMIDEIAQDLGPGVVPSIIVTCCGGGGLASGIVQGVRRQSNWSTQTKILVIETNGAESFHVCVKQNGDKVRLEEVSSIVGALGTHEVCDQIRENFQHSQPPLLSRLITDRDAVDACVRFANDHRMIVGTACGATLAAVYQRKVQRILNNNEAEHERIYDRISQHSIQSTTGPVVVIVCGGAEMSFESLLELKHKLENNSL